MGVPDIPAGSLFFSIIALWRTSKTASLTAKLQISNLLSELHDKIRPGRLAMESIWTQWGAQANKDVGSLSSNDKEPFIDFFIASYFNSIDERNENRTRVMGVMGSGHDN